MSILSQIQTGEPSRRRVKSEPVVEHNFEALQVTVKTHSIFKLNTEAVNHIKGEAYHVQYVVDTKTNKPVLLIYVPQNENETGRELSNSFTFRDKNLADRIGVPTTTGSVVYYRLTPVTTITAPSLDGRDSIEVDVSQYVAFEITEQITAPEANTEDENNEENNEEAVMVDNTNSSVLV